MTNEAICIDNEGGRLDLIIGKTYNVEESGVHWYSVISETGIKQRYYKDRFDSVNQELLLHSVQQ